MLSEIRFEDAVHTFDRSTPFWFAGIEKASPELDVRGVDYLAKIEYPDGTEGKVPIQIKSSWGGMIGYFERHADHGMDDVVVIVMLETRDGKDIRRILYQELRKIIRENIRFDTYFEQLLSQELSPATQKRLDALKRAENPENAPRSSKKALVQQILYTLLFRSYK